VWDALAVAAVANGRGDPTTRWASGVFERATLTPEGPGAVRVRVAAHPGTASPGRVERHGPGGDWLVARLPAMLALSDDPPTLLARHEAVAVALRRHRVPRIAATHTAWHELLPAILGQRITARQARAQWRALCLRLGEPAPGLPHLRLPPTPEALRATTSWDLHALGIERQRGDTLRRVAAHGPRIARLAAHDAAEAREWLTRLRGVGPWTAAVTVAVSHGDPDAVPVGDWHAKHVVAWALAGRPRGTDEEMLELLAPYAGQRRRVLDLLGRDGWAAPRFGPGRRLIDVARL
jgi:3-methyladenine DNA glycosylase/8-oxoguanine DNA glycosylase